MFEEAVVVFMRTDPHPDDHVVGQHADSTVMTPDTDRETIRAALEPLEVERGVVWVSAPTSIAAHGQPLNRTRQLSIFLHSFHQGEGRVPIPPFPIFGVVRSRSCRLTDRGQKRPALPCSGKRSSEPLRSCTILIRSK